MAKVFSASFVKAPENRRAKFIDRSWNYLMETIDRTLFCWNTSEIA